MVSLSGIVWCGAHLGLRLKYRNTEARQRTGVPGRAVLWLVRVTVRNENGVGNHRLLRRLRSFRYESIRFRFNPRGAGKRSIKSSNSPHASAAGPKCSRITSENFVLGGAVS